MAWVLWPPLALRHLVRFAPTGAPLTRLNYSNGGEGLHYAFIGVISVQLRSQGLALLDIGGEAVLQYTMPVLSDRANVTKDGVLPTVQYGGPWLTVPELFFEKKQLIPALQQLLVSHLKLTS